MADPNILLLRIDNRLVHGQVAMAWTSALGANLLVVADNVAAEDKLQQELMSMTAESVGVGIRFFTLQKTIDIIAKASPSQKIFIVCKTPKDARTLVEGGVPIHSINVGNMHFSEGKKALTKKVYVDDKDVTDFKAIMIKVNDIFVQDTPGDRKDSLEILLKNQ